MPRRYGIFDLDLMLMNNRMWDTRTKIMYRKYKELYQTRRGDPLDESIKRDIYRIYIDILDTIDIKTIQRYTKTNWNHLSVITESISNWNRREWNPVGTTDGWGNRVTKPGAGVRSCHYVCNIIKQVLIYKDAPHTLFPNPPEEIGQQWFSQDETYFWRFVDQLCEISDFGVVWWKPDNTNFDGIEECLEGTIFDYVYRDMEQYAIYKSRLFKALMRMTVQELLRRATVKHEAKFMALVKFLFCLYEQYLTFGSTIRIASMPRMIVTRIRSLGELYPEDFYPHFAGLKLLALIQSAYPAVAYSGTTVVMREPHVGEHSAYGNLWLTDGNRTAILHANARFCSPVVAVDAAVVADVTEDSAQIPVASLVDFA